jgi:hypothetical protein
MDRRAIVRILDLPSEFLPVPKEDVREVVPAAFSQVILCLITLGRSPEIFLNEIFKRSH